MTSMAGSLKRVSLFSPVTREVLALRLESFVKGCLHLSVFFTPLVFFPWSVDALELPKQIFFGIIVCLGLLGRMGSILLRRRVAFTRHWLHLMVFAFGIVYILTGIFSQDRLTSFLGSFGQSSFSVLSVLFFLAWYTLVAMHEWSLNDLVGLFKTFLTSSFLVAVFGLLQFLGWHLFAGFATRSRNFHLVGSAYALAVFSIPALLAIFTAWFPPSRVARDVITMFRLSKPLLVLSCFLSLLILGLVDFVGFQIAWVVLLVASCVWMVSYIVLWMTKRHRSLQYFVAPMVLVVLSLLFVFFKPSWRMFLPSEVVPSAQTTWEINREILRNDPVFGLGPQNWKIGYAQFHPFLINQSPFWQARFDHGFSSFLTWLGTIGLAGIATWMCLVSSIAFAAVRTWLGSHDEEKKSLITIFFLAWFASTISFVVYSQTFALHFAWWFFTACLVSVLSHGHARFEIRKPSQWPMLAATSYVFGVVTLVGIWMIGQNAVADFFFGKGIRLFQSGQSQSIVVLLLEQAHRLNPISDMYARNLSQSYLGEVNRILKESPSNERFQQEVIPLLSRLTQTAQAATKKHPEQVENWINQGFVYQSIVPIMPEAADQAILSFVRANQLEPFQPQHATELGKLYLQRADEQQKLLEAKEQEKRLKAKKTFETNLREAQRWLRLATTLKADYYPARYYLGVLYERQGKVAEAAAELEYVLQINNKDTGVAFELSLLWYRHHEKERALHLLEQIIRAEPQNANAHWYASVMYEEIGKKKEALDHLLALQSFLPGNPPVEQRISQLRSQEGKSIEAPAIILPEPIGIGSSPTDLLRVRGLLN